MTRPSLTLETFFYQRVKKSKSCWLWNGTHNAKGYGTCSHMKTPRMAHRISWELHFGPIPYGLCVLHKCDNPPCVNPSHLFLGTRQDNIADMMTKKRHRVLRKTARRPDDWRKKLKPLLPSTWDVLRQSVTERQARYLAAISGNYGYKFHSMNQLAKEERITRERIRQIITVAYGHLSNKVTEG